MGSMVELFKGRVGLGDNAMGGIQQMISAEMSSVVRDEIRPLRELTMALAVQFQEVMEALKLLPMHIGGTMDKGEVNYVEYTPLTPTPVAQSVRGLESEKVGSEIVATLMNKMPNPHVARLRAFYTDLERELGVNFSSIHKARTANIKKGEDGKYPFRKIDSIVMSTDPEAVFTRAKEYKFKV